MPIGGFEVGRFLEITCPKEQARYRQADMLWLRDGDDPTDEYDPCGKVVGVTDEYVITHQKAMIDAGWKYAILIEEDDEGDD